MCGRYTLKTPKVQIEDELGIELPFDGEVTPRYNIAPTQSVLVVTSESPRTLQFMRWGLIPSWAKDPTIGSKMLNARAETLLEKSSFKSAFQKRRCLIVSDGFYEWKKTPASKKPMHIHNKGQGLMIFAGIWESWTDAEGKVIRSNSLITTEPNPWMSEIHDRMPVILLPKEREAWLNESASIAELQSLLRPLPDGILEATEVSTLVNSARNEGPELLLPPAQTSLF